MYSTFEPGSYSSCGKTIISPLSIAGGYPHFPAASKIKYRKREYMHQYLLTVNAVISEILHNSTINVLGQIRKNPKGKVKKNPLDIGTEHKIQKILSLR